MRGHRLRKFWREFRNAPPGDRFRTRHRRRQAQHQRGESSWSRALVLLGALGCMAIAVPLMIIPGPAILFWLLAGFLVAGESGSVAKWLDRSELAARTVWNRWRKKRRRKS